MVARQCECIQQHRIAHLKMVKTVRFILCIIYRNKNFLEKRSYMCLASEGIIQFFLVESVLSLGSIRKLPQCLCTSL